MDASVSLRREDDGRDREPAPGLPQESKAGGLRYQTASVRIGVSERNVTKRYDGCGRSRYLIINQYQVGYH